PQLRAQRAWTLAHLGQHGLAALEGETLAAHPQALPRVASVYAVNSAAVERDATLSTEAKARLREQYACRAVSLLEQAHAAGLSAQPANRVRLQRSPDLAPLRPRDDFQKLLAQIDRAARTEGP